MAACYAPVLGRKTKLQAVEDARTDAAEVLLERSRLEEASRLAGEVVAGARICTAGSPPSPTPPRAQTRSLSDPARTRRAQARKEEERQADLLLDGLTEARFARARALAEHYSRSARR